ncbi:MAG: hypothetical protein QNJ11_15235 [Woeseiaceae bacterium]|nr:hypothetical protein [Woeseiaceae bacterium]
MYWLRTAALLLLAGNACAVEGFIVGGGIEADSADGIAVSAIADVGLTEKTWLTAAAARNSVDGQSGRSLDTWYGDLSLDHWFNPVGVRGGVAYWGDSDTLESIDWQGSVYWRGDSAMFGIDYEYRDFTVQLPEFDLVPGREVNFDATGVGLSTRFDISDTVSLGLRGMDYDYSVNLTLTDNRPILQLLTFSRLSLINSLVDYRANATLNLDAGRSRWQLDVGTFKGEVDGGRTISATVRFMTPLGENSDIELGLGIDDSDLYGDVTFFSVYIFFYGG